MGYLSIDVGTLPDLPEGQGPDFINAGLDFVVSCTSDGRKSFVPRDRYTELRNLVGVTANRYRVAIDEFGSDNAVIRELTKNTDRRVRDALEALDSACRHPDLQSHGHHHLAIVLQGKCIDEIGDKPMLERRAPKARRLRRVLG